MSIPDFVAGFVFGMTAENHLTEVEDCFTGGELMASEIKSGIADIKKGGWENDLQGIIEFGLVALQIPQSLHTCESMDEDIAAIESWASIFKNPKELAETVSKSLLFHRKEIKADIASIKSDWTAKHFFKSGADLAALMNVAVGPISSTTVQIDLPPVDPFVPDFMAGLLYSFTGNDHRTELEGCMTDLEPLANDLETAFEDIKSFHIMKFAGDLGNFIWMLPEAVSSCEQLTEL